MIVVLIKTQKHDIFMRTVIVAAVVIVRISIMVANLIKTQIHVIFVRT